MTIDPNTGLYGQYGFWHQPFFQKTWFLYLLVTLACITAGIILFFLFKVIRRRRLKNQNPVTTALNALKILQEKISKKEISVIELSAGIVSILKNYLERKFAKQCKHYTIQELIPLLKTLATNELQQNEIDSIFQTIESVLFATKETTQDQEFEQRIVVVTQELLMHQIRQTPRELGK